MLLLTAALLFVTNPMFSALPPLAQSSREIEAILDSPKTYQLLGGAEPIEQIVRTINGYLLITDRKELLVDIHYLPSNKIGPIEFELYFHLPTDVD